MARRLFGRAEQHSDQATAQAFADAVSHAFIAGFGFATLAQVVIIFAVRPQRRRRPWATLLQRTQTPGTAATSQARLLPRLDERLRERNPDLLAQPPAKVINQFARGESVVPDLTVALVRKPAHPLGVLPHAGGHEPPPATSWKPDVAAGDLDAGRHPHTVPFPRAGQRLVEVVQAEDESAVRNREPAEVRDGASPQA